MAGVRLPSHSNTRTGMWRSTIIIYLWAFVWTVCRPTEAVINNSNNNNNNNNNNIKVQLIRGAVVIRCPNSENGVCEDHCTNPVNSICWPSSAHLLRDNDLTETCHDTVQNSNRVFTSQILPCTLNQEMRYECPVNLANRERVLYVAIKLSSNGGISGYSMPNGDRRRAHNSTNFFEVATLHTPGYSPLNTTIPSHPFNVTVVCHSWLAHCSVHNVRMLLVKYRCDREE